MEQPAALQRLTASCVGKALLKSQLTSVAVMLSACGGVVHLSQDVRVQRRLWRHWQDHLPVRPWLGYTSHDWCWLLNVELPAVRPSESE